MDSINYKKLYDLQKKFQLTVEVETKDFTRFKVDNLLQVDFVNDVSFRYKDTIVDEINCLSLHVH